VFPKDERGFTSCLSALSEIHDRLLTLLKAAHLAVSRDSLDIARMNFDLMKEIYERKQSMIFLLTRILTPKRNGTNEGYSNSGFDSISAVSEDYGK